MKALTDKLEMFLRMLMAGDKEGIKSIIQYRLSMEETCFEMRREAGLPLGTHGSSNGLNIKQLSGKTLIDVLDDAEKKTVQERLWFERRRRLLTYKIGRCYVSFDEKTRPCHFQWVYDSNDNEILEAHFKGEYPSIGPEEVILEHALTLQSSRSRGIHEIARSKIFDMEVRNYGIKQFISFINAQNVPAMRAALHQGFVPVGIRRERWFLFRHRFVFENINEIGKNRTIVDPAMGKLSELVHPGKR